MYAMEIASYLCTLTGMIKDISKQGHFSKNFHRLLDDEYINVSYLMSANNITPVCTLPHLSPIVYYMLFHSFIDIY